MTNIFIVFYVSINVSGALNLNYVQASFIYMIEVCFSKLRMFFVIEKFTTILVLPRYREGVPANCLFVFVRCNLSIYEND